MFRFSKLFSLFLAGFLLLAACGGSGDQSGETGTVAEDAANQQQEKALSPSELGDKIGALYIESIQEATELLADKPEVTEIQEPLAQLKESYVKQLFELGGVREGMDPSARAQVDSRIRIKVNSISDADWYKTYNDIQTYYFQNREFHKLVISFNIIGQYANYDLLKKQEPEEARRLGLEIE